MSEYKLLGFKKNISQAYCVEKQPRDVSAAQNESPQYGRNRICYANVICKPTEEEFWVWVRLGLMFQQTVQTNHTGSVGVGVLWFQNRNNVVGSENVMFLPHGMNHPSVVGI